MSNMTAKKGAQIMGRARLCLSLHLKVFAPVWVAHNWNKFGAKKKSPFFSFLCFLMDQGDHTQKFCAKNSHFFGRLWRPASWREIGSKKDVFLLNQLPGGNGGEIFKKRLAQHYCWEPHVFFHCPFQVQLLMRCLRLVGLDIV